MLQVHCDYCDGVIRENPRSTVIKTSSSKGEETVYLDIACGAVIEPDSRTRIYGVSGTFEPRDTCKECRISFIAEVLSLLEAN